MQAVQWSSFFHIKSKSFSWDSHSALIPPNSAHREKVAVSPQPLLHIANHQATPRDHLPCWAQNALAPDQLAQSSTSSLSLWQYNSTCLGHNMQGCSVLMKMGKPHLALGYTQILQSTTRLKASSSLHCLSEWIWGFWQDFQTSAPWQMPVWLQTP